MMNMIAQAVSDNINTKIYDQLALKWQITLHNYSSIGIVVKKIGVFEFEIDTLAEETQRAWYI